MKKITFILFLFASTLCSAQVDFKTESDKKFIKLMNYTPKAFKTELSLKPKNKFLKSEINSIAKLKLHYFFQDEFKYDDIEVKWLEDQINQLAVAYFLEKQPIILKSIYGSSGCPEELVTTEFKNKKSITILYFCSGGCVVNNYIENFIRIFNNRTEKLLLTE